MQGTDSTATELHPPQPRHARLHRSNTFSGDGKSARVKVIRRNKKHHSKAGSLEQQAEATCRQNSEGAFIKDHATVNGILTTAHLTQFHEAPIPHDISTALDLAGIREEDEEGVVLRRDASDHVKMNGFSRLTERKRKAHSSNASGSSDTSSSAGNWLDRKFHLFGSIRLGRNPQQESTPKETTPRNSPRSSRTFDGSERSRSPMVGGHRPRSGTSPARQKSATTLAVPSTPPLRHLKSGSRHSMELQTSTGFDVADYPGSGPRSLDSMHTNFGSCKDLYSTAQSPKTRVAAIRKAHSLPRTVLYSPVMSRSSSGTTRNSYGCGSHIAEDSLSPSPPSQSPEPRSCTPLSASGTFTSFKSSQDTLNPTEDENSLLASQDESQRGHLVDQSGLAHSSSLPFDPDMIVGRVGSSPSSSQSSLVQPYLAIRSQSYNTASVQNGELDPESLAMRESVVRFLVETEQTYIHSLRSVCKEYLRPLTQLGMVDSPILKDTLYLMRQLSLLHEQFCSQLEERMSDWDSEQPIGDLFVDTFTQKNLQRVYRNFVQNYVQTKRVIQFSKQSRPSLVRFLEERRSNERHGRLSLDDLLIKPVQRIPRYVLFLRDLLKYTTHSHPDHASIHQALLELMDLAEKVNEAERESGMLKKQQELVGTVEGLAECLSETTILVRYDFVTEIRGSVQRRERLLMLFSDQLVCASARRKGSGFRRSTLNISAAQAENSKYRVKWCSPLQSLTVSQTQASLIERRQYNTLERIVHNFQKDEALLLQMSNLATSLHTPHQDLNTLLQEMLGKVRTGMNGRRQEIDSLPHDSARLDLVSHESTPASKYAIVFSLQQERQQWEQELRRCQLAAKNPPQPMMSVDMHDGYIPTVEVTTEEEEKDDGLLLEEEEEEEEEIEEKNGVIPCPEFLWPVAVPSCRVGSQLFCATASVDWQRMYVCANGRGGNGYLCMLSLGGRDTPPRLLANLSLSSSSAIRCSCCVTYYSPTTPQAADNSEKSSMQTSSWQFVQNGYPENSGRIPLQQSHSDSQQQWLWVGLESGELRMLPIGTTLSLSSSEKLSLGTPINCILQEKRSIYVGLENGKVIIFNVSSGGVQQQCSLTVGKASVVACSSYSGHVLVATSTAILKLIDRGGPSYTELLSFSASTPVKSMAVSGHTVCVAFQTSLSVSVYSQEGAKLRQISIIDCKDVVMTALTGYDPIVLQHKCSQARITCMCSIDRQLLLGTSAGVIVRLPLIQTLTPSVLGEGHVDAVNTLLAIPRKNGVMLLSAGHGMEELAQSQASDSISETEGCLLFWHLL